MKIVAIDGYTLNPGDNPWDSVAALGEFSVFDHSTPEQTLERAKHAEVIVTNKAALTAAMMAQLPQLKLVAVTATGFNVVDIAYARTRGIPVVNVPEYGTDSVAQFVMALILELALHIGRHDRAVKDGKWARSADFCFWETPLIELTGRKLGILGFGRIGRRVGELAHAFGMSVIAFSRSRGVAPAYAGFEWARSVEDLFAQSDFISLHSPQTPENTGFVNRELLGKMKRTAYLINTARGGLINEADLKDALDAGTIAGAAVDVVSVEPIKPENPLLTAKNILITPHIAWATLDARRRLMQTTAENISAFQQGMPVNVVNP